MIGTSITLIALTVALIAWLAHTDALIKRQVQRDLDIAARGLTCQGRVFAVQRAFLLDSTTRLYFEFAPPGLGKAVQCCHLERGRTASLLPAAGMLVDVHYLPDNPRKAVIGQLVQPARG